MGLAAANLRYFLWNFSSEHRNKHLKFNIMWHVENDRESRMPRQTADEDISNQFIKRYFRTISE